MLSPFSSILEKIFILYLYYLRIEPKQTLLFPLNPCLILIPEVDVNSVSFPSSSVAALSFWQSQACSLIDSAGGLMGTVFFQQFLNVIRSLCSLYLKINLVDLKSLHHGVFCFVLFVCMFLSILHVSTFWGSIAVKVGW